MSHPTDIRPLDISDEEWEAWNSALQESHLASQDHRDGAALRRLREALPERSSVTVFPNCAVLATDGRVQWGGEGDTIAEAADRCREALS